MCKLLLYSDESCYIQNDHSNCMALASVYLNSEYKRNIVKGFKNTLKKHNIINGEIKWNKISPGNIKIYKNIIDLLYFYVKMKKIKVRTLLAICDKRNIEKKYSEWYDAMYYYLFRKIVDDKLPINKLHLLIDKKDTHSHKTVKKIAEYLENYSLWDKKIIATAEDSSKHIMIQIADVLAGATTYKYRKLKSSKAKLNIINYIEKKFNTCLTKSSPFKRKDFNTFVWSDNK